MLRKTLVFLFAGVLFASAGLAQAQTNYPTEARIEVRDANGNLVGEAGLRVGDPMNIFSEGWLANSTVTFTFFSDPIVLGSRQADAQGVVRATFPVPQVEPGMHTLRLTGTGADGNPRTVEYPIKVVPTPVAGGTGGTGGTGSGVSSGAAFGKTGSDARELAAVGFALFAVGAALVVAVRKSRAGHAVA